MAEPGNQPLTEAEYSRFLDDLEPFLKFGETLNSAIEDAGLREHRTAIYDKYRLKDDFAYKIDAWQAYPGKIANNILVKRLMQVDDKIKQGLAISEEEMKNVRFIAEKHRSSQPYFTNRLELPPVTDTIEMALTGLETDSERYEELAEHARVHLIRLEKEKDRESADNVTEKTQEQMQAIST